MGRRQAFASFIAIVQFILLLAHCFLYRTWTFHYEAGHPHALQWVLGVLSVSFVVASVLAFSYTSAPVRALYKASAVWMGLLSFLFLAGIVAWVVLAFAALAGI